MPWTDQPPTEPGTYRLRFKAADGIDQTPFDAVTEPDTINGTGLCCCDRWGLWHRLEALYGRESVEWWRDLFFASESSRSVAAIGPTISGSALETRTQRDLRQQRSARARDA